MVFDSTNASNCNVTTKSFVIRANCVYSFSSITGFQMIVQSSNLNRAHKLYVNKSTNMMATLDVEESGMYLVSVLPIMEGIGITYAGLMKYYRMQVYVRNSGK